MTKTDLPSLPPTPAEAGEVRAPAFPLATGSLPTDRERWQALGKPEVICQACWHIGRDDGPDRVCEQCGELEPEGDEHGQHCPACDLEVWWIPKCPECGDGMCWTYGGIGPREFECVKANTTMSRTGALPDNK